MRERISNHFYGGNEAHFPLVLKQLIRAHPCWAALYDELHSDSPLVQRRQWCDHILEQLEFSYTKRAYLQGTVLPVIDGLPSDADVPLLADLRRHVTDLARGATPISNGIMGVVASAATALRTAIDRDRKRLITEGLNGLGRSSFGGRRNLSRVTRWLNWIALVVHDHMDINSFQTRFREALSAVNLGDPAHDLKKRTIHELELFRNDVVTSDPVLVAFTCPAIEMHTPRVTLGAVTFYSGAALLLDPAFGSAPQQLAECIQRLIEERPYEAFALVEVTGHPAHLTSPVARAAQQLRVVDGFLCSQRPDYGPPREHGHFVWSPAAPARGALKCATVNVRNSPVVMSEEAAAELVEKYDHLFPNAVEGVARPSDTQRRVRRVFESFRTSAFQGKTGEYSQAFGALWSVCELLFADYGSQHRENDVSRRLAALLTAPSGLRDDEDVVVNANDVLRFAKAVTAGDATLVASEDSPELRARATLVAGEDAPELRARVAVSRSPVDVWAPFDVLKAEAPYSVLAWRKAEREARINAGPDRARANETIRRLREQVSALYRLRNDLVHAAYSNDPVARGAYEDLRGMLASSLFTVLHNLTRSEDHRAFLDGVDMHYLLLTEGPTEKAVEMKAHALWLKRGKPLGDSWKDWFDAEASLSGWK